MHKHKWVYSSGVNRTGSFRCSGCRALVSLDVIPHGSAFRFAFRVLLAGAGVSYADMERMGNWCARVVGQPIAYHLDVRALRHKRRAA